MIGEDTVPASKRIRRPRRALWGPDALDLLVKQYGLRVELGTFVWLRRDLAARPAVLSLHWRTDGGRWDRNGFAYDTFASYLWIDPVERFDGLAPRVPTPDGLRRWDGLHAALRALGPMLPCGPCGEPYEYALPIRR